MGPIFNDIWHAKALAGEAEAVRMLAEAALGPLFSFCLYRVGGDRHACEEVVQETMLRAIRELDRYEPARAGGRILGWLTGLARNEIRRNRSRVKGSVSLDALWERMDRELLEVYAGLEAAPLADEVLEREETRAMVNVAMSQLPPQYREALEAKYVDGGTVREIARSLGTTEKAVESQLSRAREAFRHTFQALARNLSLDPAH